MGKKIHKEVSIGATRTRRKRRRKKTAKIRNPPHGGGGLSASPLIGGPGAIRREVNPSEKKD